MPHAFRSPFARSIAVLCMVLLGLDGCGAAGSSAAGTGTSSLLHVVAAENFWGSIARQEAGNRALVTSVIVNPNADPHAYEPTAADARLLATAKYVVFNGAGYDPWVAKLLAANPVNGRLVLDVAKLVGKSEGDNPHMWYSPGYVARVAARITADYKRLEPAAAAYFDRRHTHFMQIALRPYHREIAFIAETYHGVKVSSTESIFQYLAQALHLDLITPDGFMKAISEGTEPTAGDRATFERQLASRQARVFIYNSQNTTPDTDALESKARAEGIPVVPITETLQPATDSFQAWQTAQLRALAAALHRATGR